MITDIFELRYEDRRMWDAVAERERRFLVQANAQIIKQLYPIWTSEHKEHTANTAILQNILDKVAVETGVTELHPVRFLYTSKVNGNDVATGGKWMLDTMYQNVLCAAYDASRDADIWMKRRLSIVELAFRHRENEIFQENATLEQRVAAAIEETSISRLGSTLRIPGSRADGLRAYNKQRNEWFASNVEELNRRFEQARFPLSYHNGFIQIKTDQLVSDQIETPFWKLVSGKEWTNVDADMKSAIDLRDTGGRDPAFYAVRALESTIKIICDILGRTRGSENGAAQYIISLSIDNGRRFIDEWEKEMLIDHFRRVRNPINHGPGAEEMVTLSEQQTAWAIEASMAWIKTLIGRLGK